MNNDPELSGKYLGSISADFVMVADVLKEASYQIRKRGFSDFPVFVLSKEPQPIGQLLIEKDKSGNAWIYAVTYIDEFEQRGVVTDGDSFRKTYKDPDEFCCLFVIDSDFTNFVFIPYPED